MKAFLSNARAATPEFLALVCIGLISWAATLMWGEGAGLMAGGILGILALLEWSRDLWARFSEGKSEDFSAQGF